MKRATARRAASNRAVVSSAIAYTPRCTFAYERSMSSSIAHMTDRGFCALDALSR